MPSFEIKSYNIRHDLFEDKPFKWTTLKQDELRYCKAVFINPPVLAKVSRSQFLCKAAFTDQSSLYIE